MKGDGFEEQPFCINCTGMHAEGFHKYKQIKL